MIRGVYPGVVGAGTGGAPAVTAWSFVATIACVDLKVIWNDMLRYCHLNSGIHPIHVPGSRHGAVNSSRILSRRSNGT